jgi:hypothetical protein
MGNVMAHHPISDEIGAAFGAFVAGGSGPRHATLSRIFAQAGYSAAAPYAPNSSTQQMNKEDRVRVTVSAAVRDPHRARDLVEGLLSEYRVAGFFRPDADAVTREDARVLRAAFARVDWELSEDGELRPAGIGAVVAAEGRPAIEDQLSRLRRATDDPALLLGTAKEMLESTAKYVLDAFAVPYTPSTSFDELWFHARDRLGMHPRDIDASTPGGPEVREILQSCWSIARMSNEIRNIDGTGHGRTLPALMRPELALLVVREACSVAQMMLASLDRHLGR